MWLLVRMMLASHTATQSFAWFAVILSCNGPLGRFWTVYRLIYMEFSPSFNPQCSRKQFVHMCGPWIRPSPSLKPDNSNQKSRTLEPEPLKRWQPTGLAQSKLPRVWDAQARKQALQKPNLRKTLPTGVFAPWMYVCVYINIFIFIYMYICMMFSRSLSLSLFMSLSLSLV